MDSASDLYSRKEITIKEVVTEREKKDAFWVREKVFIEEQKVPVELEHDHEDQLPSTVHFVGYMEKQPIAAARLRAYQPTIGKVERVAVLAEYRRTGIGATLMNELEHVAESLGFSKLKLNAQLHAASFYKQLGYTPFGETFMEAGIEHIAMVKSLG